LALSGLKFIFDPMGMYSHKKYHEYIGCQYKNELVKIIFSIGLI